MLVNNTWYINANKDSLIFNTNNTNYGFINNIWDYHAINDLDGWNKATDKEIDDSFNTFAKIHYPKNTIIKYLIGRHVKETAQYNLNGNFTSMSVAQNNQLQSYGTDGSTNSIYFKGQWAEKILTREKDKFKAGDYVVLLSTCDGDPDVWKHSIPTDTVYQLKTDASISCFNIVEDINGNPNSWALNEFSLYHSHLKLRHATVAEIDYYKTCGGRSTNGGAYRLYTTTTSNTTSREYILDKKDAPEESNSVEKAMNTYMTRCKRAKPQRGKLPKIISVEVRMKNNNNRKIKSIINNKSLKL